MSITQTDDVEIYIRRPGADKVDDEEYVWCTSYQRMAGLSTRTVIEIVNIDLDEGPWKIGIREQGDEQYEQSFDVPPLLAGESAHIVKNHVAGIMNHWRE